MEKEPSGLLKAFFSADAIRRITDWTGLATRLRGRPASAEDLEASRAMRAEREARWDEQVRAVYDLFVSAERYLESPNKKARADLKDALARSEYLRTEMGPNPSKAAVPFQTRRNRGRAA